MRVRHARARSLGVALDERENAFPGVVGSLGKRLVAPIEEAVRRAVVDDHLVVDACKVERVVEILDVLWPNRFVGTAHQREYRRLELARALRRARGSVRRLAWPAVEADRACEAVPGRSGEPGMPAAEAEADGEDRVACVAQMGDGRGDVG